MIYLNGKSVGFLVEEDIQTSVDNIQIYQFQDLANINQTGGQLATDEEYINAELQLQDLYKLIMEGENE